MKSAQLTKKEQAWLDRFKKTMAAAPESLREKISSYTIGDSEIILYDKVKFNDFFSGSHQDKYHCELVEDSESEICSVQFPFDVEATSG